MAGLLSTRPSGHRLSRRGAAGIVAVLSLLVCGGLLAPAPIAAQELTFPVRPGPLPKSPSAVERANSKQMLVQAREINYDYTNNQVSAVGNVQMYYGGATIEADKVVYDQKTKRLRAEGNVRLTEQDGKVTYGQVMDLSDDYRDGFVDSLRLDTPDQTRLAAARAERTSGNYTVFQNGVYTACAECKDNPKKPPLWQVKAARIIHDQGEKMMYFEDARLEFFGAPLMYFPYFSAPDPTVKRKTGVLMPSVGSSGKFGMSLEVPYYWALAPNYDVTFAPMITTKQGPMLQGEFRQRLMNGAYSIRAAGIKQWDPNYFVRSDGTSTPGARDWRGSVESSGQFALSDKWTFGWDAIALSDKTFLQDYNPNLSRYRQVDALQTALTEGVSQLYLAGKGNRSYFDARSIYYLGFSEADAQSQIPVIHPVIDYTYTFDRPILGGEVGFNANFTSLTRNQANFDAISTTALNTGACGITADPALKTTSNCLLRGVPGTYSRFSAETHWRRTITDQYGQVFTPFASVRADAGAMQIKNDPGVSNYIDTGDTNLVRAMPTIGLEYRYPFISVQSWGTQTIEPIAQVIARPNETQIGRWPNEDAQSLIFDDSNLFKVDKFSGWDRVEGGGRANYGVQYTAQFNKGGFVNALFGQSYQLFGENSYSYGGTTNTGLNSGLDTTRSDYVARVSYQPNSIYSFTSRFRFDHDTFETKRFELEARANFDRWTGMVLYGDYAAQPELGFLNRRQGIYGLGTYKLDANWVLLGGARYDINAEKFDQTRIGVGYVDDCLILAVNYITSYIYSGNVTNNHTIMLQLSLRTLGGTSVTQAVGNGQ
ncbi:LPS-assembly protein LptD [Pseudolabrys taiwanensis]|uniref:LPS-assembly protein LptD n=1 Tax=Pseudolabrys taiwanensis TaxID=331696 RepID=A0A345ZUB3_9HYPH|nr:LPS-assembly protein LptD [Pseudolabrys taiwanensis]AXK80510.1 LPS-assembly protein LptD [Pseudolabrys taiwanensis]